MTDTLALAALAIVLALTNAYTVRRLFDLLSQPILECSDEPEAESVTTCVSMN